MKVCFKSTPCPQTFKSPLLFYCSELCRTSLKKLTCDLPNDCFSVSTNNFYYEYEWIQIWIKSKHKGRSSVLAWCSTLASAQLSHPLTGLQILPYSSTTWPLVWWLPAGWPVAAFKGEMKWTLLADMNRLFLWKLGLLHTHFQRYDGALYSYSIHGT